MNRDPMPGYSRMRIEGIVTGKAPKPSGPYSQAVRAGDFLFVAGTGAFDPSTGKLVSREVGEQTRQVLRNIQAVLEAAGSGLDRVVKTTVFLSDWKYFAEMNEAYAEFFRSGTPPARSTVQGARWPEGHLVAIEALAQAGGEARDPRTEILEVDAEWARVAESGDLERILSYWSDDAALFPPGIPALVGKAAIREYVAQSLLIPGFRITWKTNEVTVAESGDLAYGVGTNRVSFQGPDGKPVTMQGQAVTVWRRDAGAWKCVIDIWNDVRPPR